MATDMEMISETKCFNVFRNKMTIYCKILHGAYLLGLYEHVKKIMLKKTQFTIRKTSQ